MAEPESPAPRFRKGQAGKVARGTYAGRPFTIEHDQPRADGFWTVRLETAPNKHSLHAFPASMLLLP